mgnify:CR=1 FL=1
MAQIHWFPGHMSKALHEVEEKIKLVAEDIANLSTEAKSFNKIGE